jgi:hypothetical protein
MLSATWLASNASTITRTRKAYVEAGKTTEVDMTAEDPKQPDVVTPSSRS